MVTRRRGRNNDAALKNTQLSPQVQHLWAGQQKPIKSRRFEAETWNIKTQWGGDGRETLLCDGTTHNYWITTQLLLNNEDSGCQTYTKLHFTGKHWSDFMCVCMQCVVVVLQCVVFVCCVCSVCVPQWSCEASSSRLFPQIRIFLLCDTLTTNLRRKQLFTLSDCWNSTSNLTALLHFLLLCSIRLHSQQAEGRRSNW